MDGSFELKVAEFILLDDIDFSSSNPVDAYLEKIDGHDVTDMMDGTG